MYSWSGLKGVVEGGRGCSTLVASCIKLIIEVQLPHLPAPSLYSRGKVELITHLGVDAVQWTGTEGIQYQSTEPV